MPTEQMTEPQEQASSRARPAQDRPTTAHRDPPARRCSRWAARSRSSRCASVGVSYDGNPAVRNITLDIGRNRITALIGPSGCGKSTLIRCFNRMNDLIPGATVDGSILYHGQDLYGAGVDPVEVRKLIGMVFQKPNPFPKSIYDNIAFGPRVIGMKGDMDGDRRAGAEAGGAVGRGQGPPEGERVPALRRTAAAPVHRALPGGRAGRDPDGRAVLGARPDRDLADRGPDAGAEEATTRS